MKDISKVAETFFTQVEQSRNNLQIGNSQEAERFISTLLQFDHYERKVLLSTLRLKGEICVELEKETTHLEEVLSTENNKKILDYLRNQAYLTKSVRIDTTDYRGEAPSYYSFYFEGGLLSLLDYLLGNRDSLHSNPFYAQKEIDGIDVDIRTLLAITG